MNSFELGILDKINEIFESPFFDALMPAITKLGDDGIIWIILTLVFLCFKKTRKMGFSMALSLILGFIIGNLFLKNIVARIRPYDLNSDFSLLISKLSDYSFPSGHTLSSFEAATAIFIRNKKYGIPALVLAVLIAFSRLYLYVHYPTDVLAGMILGIGIAILASFIADKIYSKVELKKTK